MIVKKFGRDDDGDFLCNGANHYRRSRYLYHGEIDVSLHGPCDLKACLNGKRLKPESLYEEVQDALGIQAIVPEGMILVEEYRIDFGAGGVKCGYHVYLAGTKVAPTKLRTNHLLADGEECAVNTADLADSRVRKILVRNEGGSPRVHEHPDQVKAEKAFAQSRLEILLKLGFDRQIASAIMNAARPSNCLTAIEWAYSVKAHLGPQSVTALSPIVDRGYGKDYCLGVLRKLGLEIPAFLDYSPGGAKKLFAIVRGAWIALSAGLPELGGEQVRDKVNMIKNELGVVHS